MNIYLLIPLFALMVHGFAWTFVFAQKRKTAVHWGYLILVGNLELWVLNSFFLKLSISDIWIMPLLKANSIHWLAIGFLFLHFGYAFLKRKKDFIYYTSLTSVILAIIINFSTNLVIQGYIRNYWGLNYQSGLLYFPFIILIAAAPIIYTLALLYLNYRKTSDSNVKKQIWLLISGTIFSMVFGIISTFFAQSALNLVNIVKISAEITIIQSLSILYAIIKYRFLNVGIEDIAEEVFVHAHVGIVMLDMEERIIHINKSAHNILPNIYNSFMGLSISSVISDYANNKNNGSFEYCINVAEQVRTLFITVVTVEHFNSEVGKVLILRDITEHKRIEKALKESEERYRTLFNSSPDAIFLMDPHNPEIRGLVIECNEAACTMNGYSQEELIGKSIDILHPKETSDKERDSYLSQIWREKVVRREGVHCRKDGSTFLIETVGNLITLAGKELILGIDRDITERVEAQEKIWHQANHDLLTGLPNRALFSDRLSQALVNANRYEKMLAVLYLDLDRFKTINDTLGHTFGDRILQKVAERLDEQLKEGDTIARLGGDEFVILLPQIAHIEDAVRLAQKILELGKQPIVMEEQELYITISMGIAFYPADGADVDTLLKNSDTALNRVKNQGGNNYQFYAPVMNSKASERLLMENELRRAIKNKEFVVYYQPQLDINTWRVIGFEALIRWKHPENGMVYPDEFISIAEEIGLIVPIGELVLREVCAQNKRWLEEGLSPKRIAVNLSARQFHQRDLVTTVKQILEETGLASEYLELEITESVAMEDADYTIEILHQLREMGVYIALDDFGTGYSSLNYLKRFPLNIIKIDRSFIRDLTTNSNDAAIATAIISLAHNLNLSVIAEGVEIEEQLAFLKLQQCDNMQGFLFSKPLPVEELGQFLK